MAGRKQHFIPQVLQKGFGVAIGKSTRVYVFKKGQLPYRCATEGVAAQRDFYSAPSNEQSLDDKITSYEGLVLAPAIATLRQAPPGPVDSYMAAAVVVHLSIRSAFFRDSSSKTATALLDFFESNMRSEQTARALLKVDSIHTDSPLIKNINDEFFALREAIPENFRNALQKLTHFRIREKLPKALPSISEITQILIENSRENFPTAIIDGHSKALENDLEPVLRVNRLKAMNWRIIATESPAHFVLPDCLAVGSKTSNFKDMEPYSLLNDEELTGILMPISANKLLVGCIDSPELDIPSLNRSLAQCSLNFFISSQDDAQTAADAQYIGNTVSKCVDNLIREQVFDAPYRSDGDDESSATGTMPQPFTVPFKFEPACRKSGKAQAAVRNLLAAPEFRVGMRTVKEIVISDNVVGSLRQRGVAVSDDIAQIVKLGTCHASETPDGVFSQLFIRTELVNLVVKASPHASSATALIRHLGGQATYFATLTTKIPKNTWQRRRPRLEEIELRITHFFCHHYFGGRLSGVKFISDEDFSAKDDFYSQILARCIQEINHTRLHFIKHRNVDISLTQAFIFVERMLWATSTVCAISANDLHRWQVSKSFEILQDIGLGDWFELFALDLERFFNSRECPDKDNDLVLLGNHVERVLWSFGIVLSTHTPDQIWMDVLSDEQLKNLHLMLRT